jgi:hypothetical protein
MPDASRVLRHADPQATPPANPPDVESGELRPDQEAAIRRHFGMKAEPFIAPQRLELDIKDRQAKERERERIALERHNSMQRQLEHVRRDAYLRGFATGRDRGHVQGWWWGMGTGLIVGCLLTVGALKIGMLVGVA